MMSQVLTVVRKEINEITHNRRLCVMLVVLALILGVIVPFQTWRSRLGSDEDIRHALNMYLSFGYLGCATTLAWGLVQEIFYGEKARRTLETLLSTPLDLTTIWLGKTLAATVVSAIVAAPMTVLFTGLVNLTARSGSIILPASPALFQGLIVTPFLLLAFIGLTGVSLWLLFDPRPAMYITMLVIFIIYGLGMYLASTWLIVGLTMGIALGLLGFTVIAVRLLKCERIVLIIR
jgi:ABC-type transport system involved in multi-copper enzyme maturation permease subunit